MTIGKEELVAITLMDVGSVLSEIKKRRDLQSQMVGQLYPSIIEDECGQLERIYHQKMGMEGGKP